jgi:hypothetical protein
MMNAVELTGAMKCAIRKAQMCCRSAEAVGDGMQCWAWGKFLRVSKGGQLS